MEDNKMAAIAISDILVNAINKTYENISDLESIKVNADAEDFEQINPVIDSIIEDENNHIGKLQQLVDLLKGGSEFIAEGETEAIELIDNSDEFMESMTTMKKKLRLNENFDNVIDDVQAVADPVFVGANEEHDENKKKYEDAVKENKKAADETVPKEGDTGKKVTSKELKKMKLSEKLFDESLDFDEYSDFNSAVYNALSDVMFEFRDSGVEKADLDKALEWFDTHFWDVDGDNFETEPMNHMTGVREDLNESFVEEWWGQTDENPRKFARQYGLKVTQLKKNNDEILYRFEGPKEAIEKARVDGYFASVDVDEANCSTDLEFYESLKYKIAKEQIQRFTEGKMPKNWSVDGYLKKLTESKHITQKEAKSLKEWYNGKQSR